MITPLRDSWVKRTLTALFAAYFLAVLAMLFIGQKFWGFCYDHQAAMDNLNLLPFVLPLLALLMLAALRGAARERAAADPRRMTRGMLLAQLGFLLFQFVWVYLTRFHAITESVDCYAGAYALATGTPVPNQEFFRIYPHNAPNSLLTSYIIRLALLVGADPIALFPYIGALLLNLTTLMTHSAVLRLTGRRHLFWISFFVGNLWIGLSQYMMIPYSDIYAVVFPALAVWLLTCRMNRFLKWLLFAFACFFGGAVRPTALIPLIAYALYQLVAQLQARLPLKEWLKRGAAALLACLLACLPCRMWKDHSVELLAGEKDPQQALTVTHYIMLGMNYDTWGEFSNYDYDFSTGFDTVQERQTANLARAWERFSSLTPKEFVKFFLIKLYKAHAEGNFFADCAYCQALPERNNPITPVLLDFYLKTGPNRVYYLSLQQVIWLCLLTLCAAAACTAKRHAPLYHVLGIALLGVTAYSLLSENWPRYLFMFAPLFLIMSMQGLDGLCAAIRDRRAARPKPLARKGESL